MPVGRAAAARGLLILALVAGPVLAGPGVARAGEGRPLRPMGNGARSYFAPVAPGVADEVLTDSLARGILRLIREGAAGRGRRPPEPDARLHAVAETLAATLGPDEVPGLQMQEFLLSHHGLGDPVPELFMLQMGVEDDFIRDKVAASVVRALGASPQARIGVGVFRRWFRKCVVVALQRVEVEMLPVPRRLPAGGSALLGGRLRRGLWNPSGLVTPPAGDVRALGLRQSPGGSFQGSFRCDAGPGRYQVEVMAGSRAGKTVVANFPLFCDVSPPGEGPRVTIRGPESNDPREAEALLLEAVNRDRAAGRPAAADLGSVAGPGGAQLQRRDVRPRAGRSPVRLQRQRRRSGSPGRRAGLDHPGERGPRQLDRRRPAQLHDQPRPPGQRARPRASPAWGPAW